MELHNLISERIDFNDGQLRDAWQKVVIRRMRETDITNKEEVFITTAIMLFSKLPEGLQVSVENLVAKAGYSRATFFRLFGSFSKFQLSAYRFLARMAVEEYAAIISEMTLNPHQLSEVTLSVVYSSHAAIPNPVFQSMVSRFPNEPAAFFHSEPDNLAKVIHAYAQKHKHLGYAHFTEKELAHVVQVLDHDIFTQRTNPEAEFPCRDQAKRLRKMFLGFIKA